MSYILDALKKLEHEKSKKSRGHGMINIAGSLFEHERPQTPGAAGWKIVLAVTVAVLVTFGATWQILRPAKAPQKAATPLAPPVLQTPSVKVETISPLPAPPVVPVQAAALPALPPSVPAAPVRPPARRVKPSKALVPAAPAADTASLLTMQELQKRTKERKSPTVSADQAMAAPADIKLSGIAWQEERRARRAVVNGFLMQEGGVVAGARITDIYQERVRFSLAGKFFELPLVSSGASAAGK